MKRLAVITMVCLVAVGCGKKNDRKKTFPVVGKVLIDGKPQELVAVYCNSLDAGDKGKLTTSSALTDKEGKFEIGTYEKGDGVPEGNYVLTFKWGKFDPISMNYGNDKFKGKYADPKKSEVKFTATADKAEEGKPIDLGTIELKTK